jgi:thiamine pyrophosphate-dependent acetolactate synthase large subunit-like protein
MAAATGELTGRPDVVVPGTFTAGARAGLELARVERSPVVCAGATPGGALRDVVKGTAASAARAVALALARPRGPVCVADAASETAPAARAIAPDEADRVAAVIRAAERPVVVAGIAARDPGARSWVRAFAEALPAPVVATWKAKGTLPDPHPLAFGLVGASGPATELLGRADLVIGLGVDDVERDGLAIGPPATWLGPDVGAVLGDLASRLRGTRADWDVAELDRLKRRLDARTADRVRRLVALAREATPAGTIAAFDATLRDAAAAWDCVTPEDVLVPARSALAPFALPAAVGAALASPAAVVLCFTDATASATTDAAVAVARARGVALGVIALGPLAAALPRVPAGTEPALAMAIARLLAERRPLVLDAADRSV